MIVGKEKSSDGGERRKKLRRIRLVDDDTRMLLVSYIQDVILKRYKKEEKFSSNTLFTKIPDDLINTPLRVLCEIIKNKYPDDERAVKSNTMKYLGMLVREAVYCSEVEFYESIESDIRTFKRMN